MLKEYILSSAFYHFGVNKMSTKFAWKMDTDALALGWPSVRDISEQHLVSQVVVKWMGTVGIDQSWIVAQQSNFLYIFSNCEKRCNIKDKKTVKLFYLIVDMFKLFLSQIQSKN